MRVRLVRTDLPEPSYFFTNHFALAKEAKRKRLPLNLLLERNLGAGKKAYGDVWFSDRGETARYRVAELRGHQLVPNLCRSGGDVMQTVVTHGENLPSRNPTALLFNSTKWMPLH